MRIVIAVSILLCTVAAASAAPPASCVNKFAGEWNHGGALGGNRGTLTRDGRAICSQNAFCQAEGTWTCSGDIMQYTTSMGSWTYTLQPDGSITANGGAARATRVGAAPGGAPRRTANPRQTTPASLPDEPGLTRGPPIMPVNAVRTLQYQVASILAEINLVEIQKWREDNAADAKRRALSDRLIDMRNTLDQAVKDGRWQEIQRRYPSFKRLVSQFRAAQAASR